ncbi:phosphotransferase family protein [Actinobacteria bacterium IMCC26256]|nr:phosphotransferase family protein [Actinobacteria bacterium IMCC26256]
MTTIRATDLRLTLPQPAPRIHVATEIPELRSSAESMGSLTIDAADADLHVTRVAPLNAELMRIASPMLLIFGRAPRRPLIAAGYSVQRVVVRSGAHGPRLAFPIGNTSAARYALETTRPTRSAVDSARTAIVRAALRVGYAPADSVVTIATRTPGPPFPIAAAQHLGADASGGWIAWFGDGDDLQRVVFHAFPYGSDVPTTVVKISRVQDNALAFAADERGLGLLNSKAPNSASMAPKILGRFEVEGLSGSVETAALGATLNLVLDEGESPSALAHIERVTDWLIAMGAESAGPSSDLAPELERISRDILRAYTEYGVSESLLAPLRSAPAVLAHRDPGSWNIAVSGEQFCVLDWESAAYPSIPLWDLAYFLSDAYSSLDGPADAHTKVDRIAALFRGEHPRSGDLMAQLARGAATMGLPSEAIGAAVVTGWLHHGRSASVRAERSPGVDVKEGLINRVAKAWLQDPQLGPTWSI